MATSSDQLSRSTKGNSESQRAPNLPLVELPKENSDLGVGVDHDQQPLSEHSIFRSREAGLPTPIRQIGYVIGLLGNSNKVNLDMGINGKLKFQLPLSDFSLNGQAGATLNRSTQNLCLRFVIAYYHAQNKIHLKEETIRGDVDFSSNFISTYGREYISAVVQGNMIISVIELNIRNQKYKSELEASISMQALQNLSSSFESHHKTNTESDSLTYSETHFTIGFGHTSPTLLPGVSSPQESSRTPSSSEKKFNLDNILKDLREKFSFLSTTSQATAPIAYEWARYSAVSTLTNAQRTKISAGLKAANDLAAISEKVHRYRQFIFTHQFLFDKLPRQSRTKELQAIYDRLEAHLRNLNTIEAEVNRIKETDEGGLDEVLVRLTGIKNNLHKYSKELMSIRYYVAKTIYELPHIDEKTFCELSVQLDIMNKKTKLYINTAKSTADIEIYQQLGVCKQQCDKEEGELVRTIVEDVQDNIEISPSQRSKDAADKIKIEISLSQRIQDAVDKIKTENASRTVPITLKFVQKNIKRGDLNMRTTPIRIAIEEVPPSLTPPPSPTSLASFSNSSSNFSGPVATASGGGTIPLLHSPRVAIVPAAEAALVTHGGGLPAATATAAAERDGKNLANNEVIATANVASATTTALARGTAH